MNSDSDSTGSSNLVEINAGTQPGWTTGLNTVYVRSSGATSQIEAPAAAGTNLDPVVTPPPTAPEIGVTPLALDFGAVTVNTTSTLTTTIANSGDAELAVNSVTISGNTDFALNSATPVAPFNIAAGASATVSVNYTPTTAASDSGTLTIASNDSDEASITVSLAGSGTAPATVCDIDVTPLSQSFGSVEVGQTATRDISLGNTGNGPCTVTALALSNADFSRAPTPVLPITVQPGSPVNIQIVYSPATAAADTGTLTVSSNDPDEAAVTVNLSGTGVTASVCAITISPASLAFGTVETGLSSSMSVQVQNTGTAECSVSALTVSGAAFALGGGAPTLPATVAPTASITVPVVFAPTAAGAASGTLTVVSTDPAASSREVPLTGTGRLPATECNITVSASSLDFGSVTLGASGNRSLTLGNSGQTSCTVNSLTVSGGGFALGAAAPAGSFAIAPAESVLVPVTYTPAQLGSNTGSLGIASTDPDQPLVSVDLTGTGVEAAACTVSVAPTALDFGAVPIGATQTRTTTVTNTGNSDCTVNSLDLTGGAEFTLSSPATLPRTLIPGEALDVLVAYQPSAVGDDAGTLSIGSSDPAQPVVVVSLVASGVETPALCDVSVDPLSLEFGTVGIGASPELSAKVTNNGTAACTIEWQLDAGASTDFALALGVGAQASATVPPGGDANVTVRYSPSNTGDDSGSVVIQSNDPDTPSVTVSLTGSGVETSGIVDLAIVRFSVTEEVRLSGGGFSSDDDDRRRRDGRGSISIRLLVENRGQTDQPRQATVVGVQNGAEVYRESRTVRAKVQGRRSSTRFPSYTPVSTGDIRWTVVIADDNSADSTASAVTEVRSAGSFGDSDERSPGDDDDDDDDEVDDEDDE